MMKPPRHEWRLRAPVPVRMFLLQCKLMIIAICLLVQMQKAIAKLPLYEHHHPNTNSRTGTSSSFSRSRARLDVPVTNSIENGMEYDDVPIDESSHFPISSQYAYPTSSSSSSSLLAHTQGLYSIDKTLVSHPSEYYERRREFNNNEIQLMIPASDDTGHHHHHHNNYNNNYNQNHNRKQFKTLKTGTTIVGIKTSNAIIIAADTRATEGTVVADKLCEKVHQLSQNVWCCGAGTSADLDALTRKIRYTVLLKRMVYDSIGNNGGNPLPLPTTSLKDGDGQGRSNNELQDDQRTGGYIMNGVEEDIGHPLGQASISEICNMIRENLYKNNGQIGANLVLGGVDPYTKEPILTAIHPHGSIDVIPYTSLGSGGLAATGVLESRYRIDLTIEEGVELVKDAVRAGIENDLGSGSQIDLCIITRNGVTYRRGVLLEETLPSLEDEEKVSKKLFLDHTAIADSKTTTYGVNGFGSLPYIVKKRKKLIDDEDQTEKKDEKWLKYLLK